MLFIAFVKALRDLFLPGILKLFLVCLVTYTLGGMALSFGISKLINTFIDVAGPENALLRLLSGMGGVMITWFLFPVLYPILVSFFDEKMVATIEREDYPQLAPAEPPFWPTLWNDIVFSLKAIGLNILCLPFYIFPLGGLFLYYGLNGYLLGTQFFRIAAGKRISAAEASAMQTKERRTILLAGVAISFCSTIPVLNLAAPLIGVAVMTHLFHALHGTRADEIIPPRA
jgi:CysZ protein